MQKQNDDRTSRCRPVGKTAPDGWRPSAHEISKVVELRILSGTMANGNRVNENALATEFGASRTMVREAVRLLEQSGLVRLEMNRGALVRRLELSEVIDIYEAWAGLSRAAGRLAAIRASLPQIQSIESLHEEMLEMRDREDVGRYHLLNQKFHSLIFEISGNARLFQIHEQISKEMVLSSRKGVVGLGSLRISSREHSLIVDAIKAADAEGAASAFENHVLLGKQRILDVAAMDQTRPSGS